MDSLIERITNLVMAELTQGQPAPPSPKKAGRQVLVAAVQGPDGPGWQALRGVKGVRWLGVGCSEQLKSRLGEVRCLPAPELWDELPVEAVVLPHFPLATLARTAQMLGDSPAVGAALAGVVQGIPVLASSHDVERIKRHSNRLPAGFLNLFQQHLRAVEGMGLQLLEPEALAAQVAQQRKAVLAPARGKDVVTMEDLEAARRAGVKVLELAHGTIVTPLARDAAKQMGIEVSFR